MPSTTLTLGPLHFEDLEPHRFEDLVRQLIYDFRPWRQLEATGRAGSDMSFDVRGWEIVRSEPEPEPIEKDDDDQEASQQETEFDRVWLTQCKRERSIGPSKLVKYLDAIPEAERLQLYGLIFVAACDFSKQARDRFRAKAREFGVAEAHLWGKGEIEDMLFQPKNDHLLFAYFGISLQVRRRTLKTEVRAKLATKRTAHRHLTPRDPVLIRDVSDDRYPWLDEKGADRYARGRWKVMVFDDCKSDGLHVAHRRHFAYLDEDGEHWDYAECMNDARRHHHDDPWREDDDEAADGRAEAWDLWNTFPEQNRAWFELFLILPYENVLAVDEKGDEWFPHPHIYTIPFHPTDGPFRNYLRISLEVPGQWGSGGHGRADESMRVEKFPRRKSTPSADIDDG